MWHTPPSLTMHDFEEVVTGRSSTFMTNVCMRRILPKFTIHNGIFNYPLPRQTNDMILYQFNVIIPSAMLDVKSLGVLDI